MKNPKPILLVFVVLLLLTPVFSQTTADEWFSKGKDFLDQGKFEEAIVCFDKAIALNPKNAEYWRKKGNALSKLGKLEEALVCDDKALSINPNNGDYWYNKGFVLGELKRFEESNKCYDRAIAINPKDKSAWNNKGNNLHELGKWKEAIECCDKALAIDPNYAKAWYNKGVDLVEFGRWRAAIKCFDKALAIDPNYELAKTSRAYAMEHLKKLHSLVKYMGQKGDPPEESVQFIESGKELLRSYFIEREPAEGDSDLLNKKAIDLLFSGKSDLTGDDIDEMLRKADSMDHSNYAVRFNWCLMAWASDMDDFALDALDKLLTDEMQEIVCRRSLKHFRQILNWRAKILEELKPAQVEFFCKVIGDNPENVTVIIGHNLETKLDYHWEKDGEFTESQVYTGVEWVSGTVVTAGLTNKYGIFRATLPYGIYQCLFWKGGKDGGRFLSKEEYFAPRLTGKPPSEEETLGLLGDAQLGTGCFVGGLMHTNLFEGAPDPVELKYR